MTDEPRGITEVETDFRHLSPLVDDIFSHVSRLPHSSQHRAAVASLLMTQVSKMARKVMLAALFSDEVLDRTTAEAVAHALMDASERADEEVRETEEAFAQVGRVQ